MITFTRPKSERMVPLVESNNRLLHILIAPGGKPPPPELAASWSYIRPHPNPKTRK